MSLILVLWVCAILLFVHRWGKIRMLVPHQPRYAYAQAKAAETIPVRIILGERSIWAKNVPEKADRLFSVKFARFKKIFVMTCT